MNIKYLICPEENEESNLQATFIPIPPGAAPSYATDQSSFLPRSVRNMNGILVVLQYDTVKERETVVFKILRTSQALRPCRKENSILNDKGMLNKEQ